MKKILIVCFGALLLAGCHSRYNMTLNNATKISGVSRPVLDKTAGVYRYKTATGREQTIPVGKVISIEAQ